LRAPFFSFFNRTFQCLGVAVLLVATRHALSKAEGNAQARSEILSRLVLAFRDIHVLPCCAYQLNAPAASGAAWVLLGFYFSF